MYKDKKIMALVPARGGSKRLADKNIRLLCGRPLLAWTIEEAKKSRYLDKIAVSTDERKIAEIAQSCGAEVPFMRPKELAADQSKTFETVIYAMDYLENKGEAYDLLILLQPTSPLRTCRDIDAAIDELFLKKYKALVSVCELEYPSSWIYTLPDAKESQGPLKRRLPGRKKEGLYRSYRLNGAIYLAYCEYLREKKGFFGEETFAYVMPRERSVDIDDELDFNLAEFFMKRKNYSPG